MRLLVVLLFVLVSLAGGPRGVAGTVAEADAIRAGYRREMEAWTDQLRQAASVERQREIWGERPDGRQFARRMWRCIGGQLAEPWTLESAAWLLRMSAAFRGDAAAPGAVVDGSAGEGGDEWPAAISAIRDAVEKHHLASPDKGLIPMTMAMVDVPDPRTLTMLEKIEASHPDRSVQGVAALAISMVLKTLGDEGDVMRRRLTMLRKAIIDSAEIEIEGVTVAKIAEDELYVISHLSKGRVAPDLVGTEVSGRPLKLSDHEGKVVVLLFWGTWTGEAERVLGMAGKLVDTYRDRPFALVGVNSDTVATLRQLVASGDVRWPNFSDPDRKLAELYRVTAWPIAFVLDRQRVIRYIGAPGSFVELTVEAVLGDG